MTDKRKSTAIIAGFVVLGMLTFGVSGATPVGNAVFTQEETPTETPVEEETPTETPVDNVTIEPGVNVTVQTANVTFKNQTSDGTGVLVDSTVLPDGGFLVAYNKTMASPVGNSSFLENGTQENTSVMLNQPLTENTTLIVAAFNDTNGNQQFDLGIDEVYLAQGQPAVAVATVNVTATDNVTTPTPEAEETSTPIE